MNFLPFLDQSTHANVRMLCWIWVALFAVLLWRQWRSKRAFGLPLAYALGLTMIHLGGGFAYAFDHYRPQSAYLQQGGNSLAFTHAGFWMSTLGFAAFVSGVFLCPVLFRKDPAAEVTGRHPQLTSQLPGTLLLMSMAFFFVVAPIVRRIPSGMSVAIAGTFLSVVAVFLLCHKAYHEGNRRRLIQWLASTVCFPLLTVLLMGFMSYGIAAAIAVWMGVVRFFRPRWVSLTLLSALLFFGLTAFVNWMEYREYIRRAVWNSRDMSQRVGAVTTMIEDFEMFSPYKHPNHLEWLDVRMNQNDFVGKAMSYTGFKTPYAKGGTLWVAATAWVPRILWPGKPKFGGSGDLVTTYTGQKLSEETSFGVGQILEFYVNFGTPCVVIGMLCLGVWLTFIDQRAAFYLNRNDYWGVTRWMLPGVAMIQPQGSLGEVVSAPAAAAVLIMLLEHFFIRQFYGQGRSAIAISGPIQNRGSVVPRQPAPDPRNTAANPSRRSGRP